MEQTINSRSGLACSPGRIDAMQTQFAGGTMLKGQQRLQTPVQAESRSRRIPGKEGSVPIDGWNTGAGQYPGSPPNKW